MSRKYTGTVIDVLRNGGSTAPSRFVVRTDAGLVHLTGPLMGDCPNVRSTVEFLAPGCDFRKAGANEHRVQADVIRAASAKTVVDDFMPSELFLFSAGLHSAGVFARPSASSDATLELYRHRERGLDIARDLMVPETQEVMFADVYGVLAMRGRPEAAAAVDDFIRSRALGFMGVVSVYDLTAEACREASRVSEIPGSSSTDIPDRIPGGLITLCQSIVTRHALRGEAADMLNSTRLEFWKEHGDWRGFTIEKVREKLCDFFASRPYGSLASEVQSAFDGVVMSAELRDLGTRHRLVQAGAEELAELIERQGRLGLARNASDIKQRVAVKEAALKLHEVSKIAGWWTPAMHLARSLDDNLPEGVAPTDAVIDAMMTETLPGYRNVRFPIAHNEARQWSALFETLSPEAKSRGLNQGASLLLKAAEENDIRKTGTSADILRVMAISCRNDQAFRCQYGHTPLGEVVGMVPANPGEPVSLDVADFIYEMSIPQRPEPELYKMQALR